MAVTAGVPRETFPGERRVALTPRACEALIKAKLEVIIEYSAGLEAGFPDEEYSRRGALLGSRSEVFERSTIILQARTPGANPEHGGADLVLMKPGQILVGFGEPLSSPREAADSCRSRCFVLCYGTGTATSQRPEHGCAFLDGQYRWIRSRSDCRNHPAANVSDDDDRRRDHQTRESSRAWGWGGRFCRPSLPPAGWAPLCRPTICAPRYGSRFKAWVLSLWCSISKRVAQRTQAVTPGPWMRLFIAGSASCWTEVLREQYE